MQELFLRAKIPRNHWECKLSQIPVNASHLSKLVEYTENIVERVKDGKGLYFSNLPGRGKSGSAAIIAKSALAHRFSVLWVESGQIITYKFKPSEELFDENQSMYDRAASVDLLIIDEFYLSAKGHEEYHVERLLRTRIDAKKANIITSNISPTALKQKYPMLHSVLSEVTEFVMFDSTVNFRPKQ